MDDVITYNSNTCVICTNLVRVGEKGLNTILDYCKRRLSQSLEAYLQTSCNPQCESFCAWGM